MWRPPRDCGLLTTMPDQTTDATFLLTDIEGSTMLWEQHPRSMSAALAQQVEIIREAVTRHGGAVPKSQMEGDSALAVFTAPGNAVAAAIDLQRALRAQTWPDGVAIRVRIGVHAGAAEQRDGDWLGPALNRAGRLRAAAHGGQTLLSDAVAEAIDTLPEQTALRDLGMHRLRDLAGPMRIFELTHPDLDDDYPPIATLERVRHNLPLALTSFLGRDAELREVTALLASNRLVTLAGAGGMGKTRLSLQVAAEVIDAFGDGVWFVDLSTLSDPTLVARALMRVLGMLEQPGREIEQTLIDRLSREQTLLVLDNCEHLLHAAAELTATLLRACPRIAIIATTREPLGVPGEQIWRIPPLATPNDVTPGESAAVALFVDRARLVRPGFALTENNTEPVGAICSRLDGMPLAIELAAARTRMLSPAEIDARLTERFDLLAGRTDVPERQQTLRGAVEWSYDLLSAPERKLFSRISVFAGGARLDAIEEVCAGSEIDTNEVLDLVASLVDKSLLVVEEVKDESRYRMLESVRAYAADALRLHGEETDVAHAHLEWILRLAEEAELGLGGPEQVSWLGRIDRELDNIRVALKRAGAAGRNEATMRIMKALVRYWVTRGLEREGLGFLVPALTDGAAERGLLAAARSAAGSLAMHLDLHQARELYERALVDARAMNDAAMIGSAILGIGNVSSRSGALDDAWRYLEEALGSATRLGDRRGMAAASRGLGGVASLRGDFEAARILLEEAQAGYAALGDRDAAARATHTLGTVASDSGDHERAERLADEALVHALAIGDPRLAGQGMANLGIAQAVRGDHDGAVSRWEDALVLYRDLGDRGNGVISMMNIGVVAVLRGQLDEAERRFQEGLAEARELGMRGQVGYALLGLSDVRRLRGQHGAAMECLVEALRLFRETGQKRETGSTMLRWAAVIHAQGQSARAAQILGAQETLRGEIRLLALDVDDQPILDETRAAALRALGEPAFTEAWEQGRTTGWEAMVAELIPEDLEPGAHPDEANGFTTQVRRA